MKVRYIAERYLDNRFTVGKVYDVVKYYKSNGNRNDRVILIDDIGNEVISYMTEIFGRKIFLDVTLEYRNDVIDLILE